MLVFYLERDQTLFLAYLTEKEEIKKFHDFGQNHGLTPLENCEFCDFFKSMFLYSKNASFLSRTLPKTFFCRILPKKEQIEKFLNFGRNYGLTPFEKC